MLLQSRSEPIVYIGETDKELGTRVREHRESWIGAVHSKSQQFSIKLPPTCTTAFDDAKIINRATHHQMSLLLESGCIRTAGQRQAGLVPPNDASLNKNSDSLLQGR